MTRYRKAPQGEVVEEWGDGAPVVPPSRWEIAALIAAVAVAWAAVIFGAAVQWSGGAQ